MTTNVKRILLTGTALIAASLTGIGAANAAVENVGGGGAAITGGNNGVNFTANGIATIADGVNINGPVTAVTVTHGTLQFAGTSSNSGDVGVTAGGKIGTIAIQGNSTKTVTFAGAVNATTLTFGAGSKGVFNGATTIDNAIALGTGELSIGAATFTATAGIGGGTGALVINGAGTLAGGAAAVSSVTKNSAGTGTISSALTAATVTVSGGTLSISNAASTVSGATSIGANTLQFTGTSLNSVSGVGGTLTLNGTAQALGATGTAGNLLTTLNLHGSGIKTLSGAIYATTTDVGAGVTANSAASINGSVAFSGDGTVALGDTANITGTVTAATNNNGTLTFAGTSAVDGALGTGNAIKQLTINGDNTKTVTFGSTVNAQNMGFSSSGNATMNGAAAIGTVTKSGAGTATIGGTGAATIGAVTVSAGALSITNAGSSVTGTSALGANTMTFTGTSLNAVTGTGGTLNMNGASQSVAQIGSNGNALAAVTLTGSGTKTLSGSIYATTMNIGAVTATAANTTVHTGVNFTADGTLNLASGSTITGNVTTATPGQGTIAYTGPLNITGSLARLKTLTVANTLTVGGDTVAADAMDVGIQNVNVTGTFTTTANTALVYRVNTPTTSGKITASGNLTVDANTAVNMVVDTSVYVAQGQEFVLIDGNNAGTGVATLANGKLTTTSTALLHFRQKTTDTHDLIVYADRTQMNVAASNTNNGAAGTMLDALGTGGDADIDALQIRLANFTTTSQVDAVLATLIPDVSGGAIMGSVNVGGSTGGVISTRLAALRNGEEYGTGMVAGEMGEGNNFWGQVFGSSSDQDRRSGIAGYEADGYGAVMGMDTDITDNFRAGLALSYADTDIDGDDANRTDTKVDSYQVSVYGDLDLEENYYIAGQLGYMYNDIETARHDVGGIAGNTARADFHSDQYIARAEGGREFAVNDNFSLIPAATVNYSYIDVEKFTEKGAGGLGLSNVKTDELQILEFGAKLTAEGDFGDGMGGSIKPNVHTGFRYDVVGDSVATTAGLVGGGAAFQTKGFDPAQSTVNVGTGISWETSSNLEFSANYDYEHKSDYSAHSGYLRAGYKF